MSAAEITHWVSLGLVGDFLPGLTPVNVAGQRLMVFEDRGQLSTFSRDCPHRGADLSRGGLLQGNTVKCRFHGRVIGLGANLATYASVPEFATSTLGSIVVALLGGSDAGFGEHAEGLRQQCTFLEVGSTAVAAPAELVTENAFDAEHFCSVHEVKWIDPIATSLAESGALVGRTSFGVPRMPWQSESIGTGVLPLEAIAFGPYLVVSRVGVDPDHYWVITATRPISATSCIVDQTLAFPRTTKTYGAQRLRQYLVERTRMGLAADLEIWETMNHEVEPSVSGEQPSVLAFRRYCGLLP